jgi:predicted MFS family arabinose efflux permease
MAMMFTSFLAGPFVTMFLRFNVGLAQGDLKWIYLCGGLATILTTTPVGWLADRFGKLPLFRVVAMCTMVPIMLLTILPQGAGLLIVLVVMTLQMVTMSGRMVPAMAMITGCAAPGQRGSFMSMNTAVQHLSAGLANVAGGALLSQPHSEGPLAAVAGALYSSASSVAPLTGFPLVALLSCVATLASLYLAGRLRLVPHGEVAPDALTVEEQVEPARSSIMPVVKPQAGTSAHAGP